jgi:hypothetical protein
MIKYKYTIEFQKNNRFYKSNRDYVSADYRTTPLELDATFLSEDDIRYLVTDCMDCFNPYDWVHVIICTAEHPLEVGIICIKDIIAALEV